MTAVATTENQHDQRRVRSALLHAFAMPYRAYLIDFAIDLVDGDERAARAVVERAFEAVLEGRFPVPVIDTYRELRAIVTEVAR